MPGHANPHIEYDAYTWTAYFEGAMHGLDEPVQAFRKDGGDGKQSLDQVDFHLREDGVEPSTHVVGFDYVRDAL